MRQSRVLLLRAVLADDNCKLLQMLVNMDWRRRVGIEPTQHGLGATLVSKTSVVAFGIKGFGGHHFGLPFTSDILRPSFRAASSNPASCGLV